MPRHNAAEAMPAPEAKAPKPEKKKKHLKVVDELRQDEEITLEDKDLEEIEDVTDDAELELEQDDIEAISETEGQEIETGKQSALDHGDVIAQEAERVKKNEDAKAAAERTRQAELEKTLRTLEWEGVVDAKKEGAEQEKTELRKAEQAELQKAERGVINALHTERINKQLDELDRRDDRDQEQYTKPPAKIASSWDRLKRWFSGKK